jgi:hypothetical protein
MIQDQVQDHWVIGSLASHDIPNVETFSDSSLKSNPFDRCSVGIHANISESLVHHLRKNSKALS